ncbi:MAG: hypothetical protein OXC26_19130 [Albidovulum sp.]|nr:hypothetical protein [Albidovulum sp.]
MTTINAGHVGQHLCDGKKIVDVDIASDKLAGFERGRTKQLVLGAEMNRAEVPGGERELPAREHPKSIGMDLGL